MTLVGPSLVPLVGVKTIPRLRKNAEFSPYGTGRVEEPVEDYPTIAEIQAFNLDQLYIDAVDPTLTIIIQDPEVATFEADAANLENWEVNVGETGLVLSSIFIDLEVSDQVALMFTGTAVAGTITIQALAGALSVDTDSTVAEFDVIEFLSNSVAIASSSMDIVVDGFQLNVDGTHTVEELYLVLEADDASFQSYQVIDSEGQPKAVEDTLVTGDTLQVTAEDGFSQGSYGIVVITS